MPELMDLDEFFNGDLRLPWKGKDYIVPEPSADEAQRLREVILTIDPLGAVIVSEGMKLMAGAWHEAIADGIGWSHLLHMARTALFHFGMSPDVAAQYWHLGELASMLNLDTLLGEADGDNSSGPGVQPADDGERAAGSAASATSGTASGE